jgi:hypothetical protein
VRLPTTASGALVALPLEAPLPLLRPPDAGAFAVDVAVKRGAGGGCCCCCS